MDLSLQSRTRRRQPGHPLQQMRLPTPTTRQLFHSRSPRRCRWCTSPLSLSKPIFPPFPTPIDTKYIDLRRLPNRPPSPPHLLLRHRRMFPLALLHPPSPHQPPHSLSPSTPLSVRNRNRSHRPQHHHLLPPQQSQHPHLPFEFQLPPLASKPIK